MVSGVPDVQNYKTNKGYYSAPAPPPSQGTKRFSESARLRPWPPMYRSGTRSSVNGNYPPVSTSAKMNFNNINGGSTNGTSHYSNNSVYSRNKFNFHPLNGGAPANNGKYSSSVNLTNIKNAKNYFLVSQPYMKNSLILPSTPFYGHDNNLLMVNKDTQHEKGRFRKLRNPTQSPPQRSCACIRSKSMEDVRTEVTTDWAAYNNKDSFNNFGKARNGHAMSPLGQLHGKSNTRRSMDNLLEVDTTYGKRFQVRGH